MEYTSDIALRVLTYLGITPSEETTKTCRDAEPEFNLCKRDYDFLNIIKDLYDPKSNDQEEMDRYVLEEVEEEIIGGGNLESLLDQEAA